MTSSTSTGLRLALLGCGRMGQRIARRILAAGYQLDVWNRTAEKAEALVADGARAHASPLAAVRNADIVLVSQRDGGTVQELLFTTDVVSAMRPDAIVLDLSSVQPALSRDNATKLKRRDIHYLDATLTGGVVGAEAGTLLVMVGGDPQIFAQVRDMLSVLGRPIYLGSNGAGATAKLAHQMIMGATAAALAESLILAKRLGVDEDALMSSFREGLVHSRALSLYAQRMSARDFEFRGAGAALQVKDLQNALAEAGTLGVDLPLSETLLDLYRDLVDRFGDIDKSALILSIEERKQP